MSEQLPELSTEVAVQAPDMGRGVVRGVTIDQRVQYARLLAESGLLPKQYIGKPANVLYAVEWGTMLGIHPMAAITGVHIVEGKPTASAALISALVRRSGHKLRVKVTGTGKQAVAVAQIIRADDPEWTYEAVWDWKRADAAKLTGKQVWQQYPEAMLKARAITEVAREACEESLCGVSYTAEELGANVNVEGEVIEARPEPAQEPVRAPQSAPQARQAPAQPSPEAQAQRARELAVRALEQTDAGAVSKARTWALSHGLGDVDVAAVLDDSDRAELDYNEPGLEVPLGTLLEEVAAYIRSHEAAVRWERLAAPAAADEPLEAEVLL